MAAVVQNDRFLPLFNGVKNKNEDVRQAYATQIRDLLVVSTTEVPPDAALKIWDQQIIPRLFELLHSTNSADRLGGLAVIDRVIELEQEDDGNDARRSKLYRIYNYVQSLLPCNDINHMIAASKTLGHIIEIGGPRLFGENFLNFEVMKVLALLEPDRDANSRYAGVLNLRALSKYSATHFYPYVPVVLDKIWAVLQDSRVVVREGAAELLAGCLDIVGGRDRPRALNYAKILQEAQGGLKTGNADAIHGSLLAYRELLLHAGMFMKDTYIDTAELVLRFKDHKDALIRRTVVTLIPTLAMYDIQTFSEHFLHKVMGHLLPLLRKPTERSIAFIAIGHIASAVGSEMKTFLDPIMASIKEALQMRGKKNAPGEEPIFQCIGMLATAVGPNLTKHLHDQLELMFQCGLSEPLRQALVSIAKHIPPLLKSIQDRLLDLLSVILCGQHYRPLGSSAPMRTELTVNSGTAGSQAHTTPNHETLKLALTTLSSFDFTGHILNEFVRDCAVPYLEDDHADVRQAAALTCCRLLVRDPICYQASTHSNEIISDVLDKLLTVGIADPDPAIRQTVLSNLDEKFDRHMSQAENVRSLFISLNDEDFLNRETAINIIGRLAVHNPAYVMPSLRKALIQLMTELEYSPDPRSKEESAKLLTLLVGAAQRLIKPYALPMLKVILPKARDPNAAVASSVLACLGELARVGGEDLTPHLPDMIKLVIEMLQDQTSLVRRDAALRTLGQLCSSTSYVITPLIEYPQLLPILVKILKADQTTSIRRETIKVMGILGALDPYRHKDKLPDDNFNEPSKNAGTLDITIPVVTTGPASEDYYQAVVITSLLKIIKDQTISPHHHRAVECIMAIFTQQGFKCVSHLPQIIPAFLDLIRSPAPRMQEHNIGQLSKLISIVKQHIRNFLPDIFDLVQELWTSNPALDGYLVTLIESIARALHAEFKPFLPKVLPLILKVFEGELTERRQSTQIKAFHALFAFGGNVEEYMHLIIPIIVKACERSDASTPLRIAAVQTIDGLSRKVNFSDHASRVIHPLVRVLSNLNADLRAAVMDTLCVLLVQLGADFAIFVPMINKVIMRSRITHTKYDNLVTRLLNGERLPQEYSAAEPWTLKDTDSSTVESTKFVVNQQHLKAAWDVSQVATKEDWFEWIRTVTLEFIKESPSYAIRCCWSMAEFHFPLGKELFNAAFVSCWTELYEHYQEDLVSAIQTALTSTAISADVIFVLLNLAEFLEHDDKGLPIDLKTFGECALAYHAFAKALHYKELEFFSESSPAIIESLININTKLQQHDAAFGTLTLARDQQDLFKHEEWYEKLGKWHEALAAYNRKIADHDESSAVLLGRMRCLHALGEWDQLSYAVQETWINASHEDRIEIAPLAAAAAWSLSQWDQMEDYIGVMKGDSMDRSFYRAILAVHRNQFPKALQQIGRARDQLDGELTSRVGENYPRAYNVVVRVQMLSELEEIISYKLSSNQPDRQATLRKTWRKRLLGCQPDVDVWQRILSVRTLVLAPDEDTAMWIKFANLCRKSDRMVLAEKTLNSLLGPTMEEDGSSRAPPAVIYAHLKFMWAQGNQEKSLAFLQTFTARLAQDVGLGMNEPSINSPLLKPEIGELSKLLARCYLKLGEWQVALKENWDQNNIPDILHAYYMAKQFDPAWYKAWHTWALANFEVISFLENRGDSRTEALPPESLETHIVSSIEGFFRSIALRNNNSLQDTLRLLTLWFKFGAQDKVYEAMIEGFSTVSIDTWLEVIPQIIARIQTPSANIRRLISQLLTDVGKQHPQALIYPLTVASKSSSVARKNAASAIMDRMREHSPTLVDQALLVSHELIRVAILWHELWHEGLEEASRLYFTENNPEGMIAVLAPLHDMIEAGPTTTRETSFVQVFGRDLAEAREACRRFQIYGDTADLNKAWDIYYQVFKKVERQLPHLKVLDLQYVSPQLLRARNLELAVPGTYQSGRPTIRITSFAPTLTVIVSKQHPRRLSLKGSDGRDYQYGLKGHEDLRQDERVMQLFGLVNMLLSVDTDSFQRHLHIQRYPVIPLAPNAGLLGWVQDSDTLHVLVRDYRESRKILLNIEYRLMLQMAPDYEMLTVMQKVEVFEYALDNTTGQDLYRVLWLKSASSEAWLDRRSTYTRSLAVTSMVGYILGLGDRHPSNLLLDQITGKVVHIDFGDCFEVAMHREKYPEKVPFRLTRMLTHAMEVSGIYGSYKNTCEITMKVLRENKESLMAVLEAFVYDPLINWRLLQAEEARRGAGQLNESDAESAKLGHIAKTGAPNRKVKADENEIFNEALGDPGARQEVRNDRALAVYNRVQNKLTGRDFDPEVVLPIPLQVEKLIQQATSPENLCQCFYGWCAYW